MYIVNLLLTYCSCSFPMLTGKKKLISNIALTCMSASLPLVFFPLHLLLLFLPFSRFPFLNVIFHTIFLKDHFKFLQVRIMKLTSMTVKSLQDCNLCKFLFNSTLYTQASVCIVSILFSVHFLRCL